MTKLEFITHGMYLCLLLMYNILYYLECKKSCKYKDLYDCALNGLILSTIKLTNEKAKNATRIPLWEGDTH
jgi:hypothetical protein